MADRRLAALRAIERVTARHSLASRLRRSTRNLGGSARRHDARKRDPTGPKPFLPGPRWSSCTATRPWRAQPGRIRASCNGPRRHEKLEITHSGRHGSRPASVFTSIQPDGGLMWIGDHIRPRIRAPESWAPPVRPDVQLGVVHPQGHPGIPLQGAAEKQVARLGEVVSQ
jgi:hypothetical protein